MELSAEQFAQDELFDRLNVINERLNTLKIESEEVSFTCIISFQNIYEKAFLVLRVCQKQVVAA